MERVEAKERGRATVQAFRTGDRITLPTAMGHIYGFQREGDKQTHSGSHVVTVVF